MEIVKDNDDGEMRKHYELCKKNESWTREKKHNKLQEIENSLN